MLATELILRLQTLVSTHGDGDVQVEALSQDEKDIILVDISSAREVGVVLWNDETMEDFTMTGKYGFVIFTEGRGLIERPDTEQSIAEEIDDIGKELGL